MIAYIINGKSFGNCVDYVTRRTLEEKLSAEAAQKYKTDERKYEANKGEDILDHLSKDWKLIGMSEDVRVYEGRKAMADDIARPTRTRKPIESPVGHISLDFHPDDAPSMTDERMADIAIEYMKQMGLVNTPFVVVRHYDKAHPHCHLVFSRVNNNGKILSQTTNFKRNERVCKALNKKYGLHMATDKRNTNVEKLRGREKMRYEVFNLCNAAFANAYVTNWNEYVAELKRKGISVEHRYSPSDPSKITGTFYIKDGKSFPSSKIDKRYTYESLVRAFKNSEQMRAEIRDKVETRQSLPKTKVSGQSSKPRQSTSQNIQKPIVIPPLPFEFLWDVPKGDEAAYRRGETVYTFARKPADRYKAHYWIWYDFNTGKPQCSFDPPKSRDIPPAFLQQVVSSGKTVSPQSESSDFRMSHVSLSNTPNDDVCIAHGEPVSGDFKQFLENHPDMDFYDAKRKFKEEQKAKQKVRQGPKFSPS
ncbi:relaxase/mobilization nuclease domain-containing protein [Duncaniella freteri]|uniref:relaxase/mobilization nuclease domain-containing protein n=1 Tax=Duncaniella freteri TaxID=2530391 RepID=UPI002573AC8E|nr:relaxase/mobilization nuclease domain-containing protein [Duncaniella freteri]